MLFSNSQNIHSNISQEMYLLYYVYHERNINDMHIGHFSMTSMHHDYLNQATNKVFYGEILRSFP